MRNMKPRITSPVLQFSPLETMLRLSCLHHPLSPPSSSLRPPSPFASPCRPPFSVPLRPLPPTHALVSSSPTLFTELEAAIAGDPASQARLAAGLAVLLGAAALGTRGLERAIGAGYNLVERGQALLDSEEDDMRAERGALGPIKDVARGTWATRKVLYNFLPSSKESVSDDDYWPVFFYVMVSITLVIGCFTIGLYGSGW